MTDGGTRTPWVGEPGAERLYSRVRGACGASGTDLPARLAAGLGAALDMLAADPETAWLLTVEPHLGSDEAVLRAQDDWIARFGALLREAVAEDPRTTSSDLRFLAFYLIGGARFQIACLVIAGEASDLRRLLPGLLEALLGYYFDPGEPRTLARAALARR